MRSFFANCPKLVEGLLADELKALGAVSTKETATGVYFEGNLETAYRVCLWSRLANHVLMPLAEFDATSAHDLQRALSQFNWSEHMDADNTFRVDFTGKSEVIHHTHYGSLMVKDAVCDYFRQKTGSRPNVDTTDPDLRFNAHVYGDRLSLSLDLSGESLHKRGYRVATGDAPMKENLAAAVLTRAGWLETAHEGEMYFVDPMCGSGTILIEAALMATDTAPGLYRQSFGFLSWLQHDDEIWAKLWDEALSRHAAGMKRPLPDFRGYDGSPRAVSQARENIESANLSHLIQVNVREISQLTPPTHGGNKSGIIVTNPPYGERLGEDEALRPLYQYFGQRLREQFLDWNVVVLTGDPELGKAMGIRAKKHYAFFNGTIPCRLLLIEVKPEWFMKSSVRRSDSEEVIPEIEKLPGEELPASMIRNRLLKNQKSLDKWMRQNNIRNYRLYDADMPEYAAAVDVYADWAHVQEYEAPKTIDPEKAEERLQALVDALPAVLNIPVDHIVVKQRRRQRKFSQYQALSHDETYVRVQEGACTLLINLKDHLDAGLFLDHRPMRLRIADEAKGKRFLNLYCYTASATVHAAVGGAYRSTSVDMSGTYTAWARKNLGLNGLSDALHRVVQADCMKWLDSNDDQFDLIFLDPPTFSRSKRMEEDFEIQRDHVQLIQKTLKHLDKNGVLYFSTNFRPFKFDYEAFPECTVQDITPDTIDKDFVRNQKIHYCFKIMASKSTR